MEQLDLVVETTPNVNETAAIQKIEKKKKNLGLLRQKDISTIPR